MERYFILFLFKVYKLEAEGKVLCCPTGIRKEGERVEIYHVITLEFKKK